MSTDVLKNPDSLTGLLSSGTAKVDQDIYSLGFKHPRVDRRIKENYDAANLDEEMPWNPAGNLAHYVMEAYRSAKAHRDKICATENISESLRLREGIYSLSEQLLLGGTQTAVWFPLTDRMCRTMTAFLRQIMTRDDENPNFEISATPIPEVPKYLSDQAADLILQQISEQLDAGLLVDEEALVQEIDRVGDALLEEVRDAADESAKRVTEVVTDTLYDADWQAVFDDFLDDLVTYPSAIIKGPYITSGRHGQYDENTLNMVDRRKIGVRNVNPDAFFPSPDSTTCQNGTYVIEISSMNRRQLEESKRLPGFIEKNVELVLSEFMACDRDWLKAFDSGARHIRGTVTSAFWHHGDAIDVLEYHGSMPGDMLLKLGVDHYEGRDINPTQYYECEIFVVDDIVIRCVENIDPEQRRPYHKASLYTRPGSFWGKGIPLAIKDIQRVINASYRSMVRNMGFSSAPLMELDWALWNHEVSKPIKDFVPGLVLDKNSDMASHRGNMLTVHQIESRGGEFLNIMAQLIEHAELTAGLPRFLQGDPSGAGGAARTLGGLATLQGNASVGLKSAVVDIDLDILKPMVEMIYQWVLCTTDDDQLKGDAQVQVRGATHLLARETNKDRLLQTIGALFPFVEAGFIEPAGISILLREVVREIGIDPDRAVIDQDRAERLGLQLQTALAQAQGINGGVAAAGASPSAGPGGAALGPQASALPV